jgi:hypothetical protein
LVGVQPVIHASAAEELAFDDCDRPPGFDDAARQRRSRLSGADDDGIELGHH